MHVLQDGLECCPRLSPFVSFVVFTSSVHCGVALITEVGRESVLFVTAHIHSKEGEKVDRVVSAVVHCGPSFCLAHTLQLLQVELHLCSAFWGQAEIVSLYTLLI